MNDEKECEYCGEWIKSAATKCRHCGELLGKARRNSPVAPAKKIEDAATLSLIMGVLAFVVCPLLAIVGIIKGNEAKRLSLGARVPVPGMATAGLIMSWVTIVLNVIVICLFLIVFVVAILNAN